jgi:hypothetical protein
MRIESDFSEKSAIVPFLRSLSWLIAFNRSKWAYNVSAMLKLVSNAYWNVTKPHKVLLTWSSITCFTSTIFSLTTRNPSINGSFSSS